MSDYYTESQVNRIEQDAYDGAILEAGKEWERQRDDFNFREYELETRIAELEQAQRWIPVSERLPEPYVKVLACTESGYMEVDYRYAEPIIEVGVAEFYSLENVTHWMPLPQPPEDK